MYKKLSRKEIKKYYSQYYPKMVRFWEKSGPDPRDVLLRKLKLNKLKDRKILDIGCGTGEIVKKLNIIKSNDVYGVDISRKFIDMSKRIGLKALYCDIDGKRNLPFQKDYFDLIFLLDLLEHIFYPKSLFRKCHRILKSNGIIVATLPNWLFEVEKRDNQSIYESTLSKIYKNKIPEKAKRYADFNYITIDELKKILKSTDFRIKEAHGFKWKMWKELSPKEKNFLWNNPLKGRHLLLVIEKVN